MEIAMKPAASDVAVADVNGRLDLVSAGIFSAAVTRTVASGRSKIIVDLAHVPFIDSSGLGALVGALKRTRDAGGELRIAGALPDVLDILTLMRLDRVLHPYASVDEALEGL